MATAAAAPPLVLPQVQVQVAALPVASAVVPVRGGRPVVVAVQPVRSVAPWRPASWP
ncbi:hypothetical protein GS485_14095 [Rhodococcus hoagii]|nr:hypothetical protein [Prescottella equi]